MKLPPLLLTSSAVAMDPTVALKDQESRIFHTLESIGKWAQISPTNKFVICDGSGFDFAPLIRRHYPDLNIECIFFMNDAALIAKHGKGYGEGEIIRYALLNSQYLQESDWFAKCTAKLWVTNFMACTKEWNSQFLCKAFFANVFSQKQTALEYIDTRFYLVTKDFYLKNFSNIYVNLGLDDGSSIEGEFLKQIYRLNLKKFLFRTDPIISGVGGGSGKYYNTSYFRRLKDELRLKLASINSQFRDFFI